LCLLGWNECCVACKFSSAQLKRMACQSHDCLGWPSPVLWFVWGLTMNSRRGISSIFLGCKRCNSFTTLPADVIDIAWATFGGSLAGHDNRLQFS
jgi:hypothetical protein